MIVLIVEMMLSMKNKTRSFYSYVHAQTFLVFIFSVRTVDPNLEAFCLWFQVSKLDLGFIGVFGSNQWLGCSSESARLEAIQIN